MTCLANFFIAQSLKSLRNPAIHGMSLQVVLSIAASIVAFTSITIGAAYGLENSTKLYALTFMLVGFSISRDGGGLKMTAASNIDQ